MLYKQIDRELKTRRVLVVGDMELAEHHMIMKAVQRLEDTLRGRNIQVITADSPEEAFPLVSTDMDIDAFLIACNTNSGSTNWSVNFNISKNFHLSCNVFVNEDCWHVECFVV